MLCAPVTLTTLEASAEFAPLCQCLFCTEESFLLTCWPICCWLLLLQRLRAESCSSCCLPGQSRKQLCRTGSCCPRGLPDPILQSCCLDSWVQPLSLHGVIQSHGQDFAFVIIRKEIMTQTLVLAPAFFFAKRSALEHVHITLGTTRWIWQSSPCTGSFRKANASCKVVLTTYSLC